MMFKNMLRAAMALTLIASMMGSVVTAAPTANLGDGRTTVALSSDFFTALNTLRVSVGTIGEGTLRGGAVRTIRNEPRSSRKRLERLLA